MTNLAYKFPVPLPETSFYEVKKAAEALGKAFCYRCDNSIEVGEDFITLSNDKPIHSACDDSDYHADAYSDEIGDTEDCGENGDYLD